MSTFLGVKVHPRVLSTQNDVNDTLGVSMKQVTVEYNIIINTRNVIISDTIM